MSWLLLGIATVATVEAFLRLPVLSCIADMRELSARVMRVLSSSRISDHWKERVLPRYAFRLFPLSMRLAGWMILSFVPFFVIGAAAQALGQPVFFLVSTGGGIALTTVVAIGFAWLRSRPAPTGDYGAGARLLHRLSLGVPMVAEASFDMERAVYGRHTEDPSQKQHVFVAGLARAGSTILMRLLHQTGAFGSLTYRDMPFVLAPNLWARLSAMSKKNKAAEERAHGDGILVDFDSPEALEEVFWRILGDGRYIGTDGLYAREESEEVIARFREYIGLVLKRYGATRYLSKNNNNILRIGTVRQAFPNATVLIPFRDPMEHAQSLLKQHKRFCERHRVDPFSSTYMAWLVHHEFGSDHRPFVFSGSDIHGGDTNTIDYWVAQWITVYEKQLEVVKDNAEACVPVCYELLCNDSRAMWKGLKRLTDLDPELPLGLTLTPARYDNATPQNLEWLTRANDTYVALKQISRAALLG